MNLQIKPLIKGLITFAACLWLSSFGVMSAWNNIAARHNWTILSYLDCFELVLIFLVLFGFVWLEMGHHEAHDDDFEIYHICHFCGKSDTCKLGKKATEKGLSVMDCPEWEEPNDPIS
jgi:hypothetical protein